MQGCVRSAYIVVLQGVNDTELNVHGTFQILAAFSWVQPGAAHGIQAAIDPLDDKHELIAAPVLKASVHMPI